MNLRQLIHDKDYQGIEQALTANPALANEGIPYDEANPTKAHPLHRICDAVCAGIITDEEAVQIARIFLEHGANVNGTVPMVEKKDTPLVAAAGLNADRVGMLYIDRGANVQHRGCHGGTALHWAAWCGRPKLVRKLVEAGAEINKRCIDFISTPLFWAVHGLKNDGYHDTNACVESASILLEAGADKSIPNIDGHTVWDMLEENDRELKELLTK